MRRVKSQIAGSPPSNAVSWARSRSRYETPVRRSGSKPSLKGPGSHRLGTCAPENDQIHASYAS